MKSVKNLWKHISSVTSLAAVGVSFLALGGGLAASLDISKELLISFLALSAAFAIGVSSTGVVRILRKLPRARRVFLSYRKEKDRVAHEIAQALRKEGVRVWIAEEQLKVGVPFEPAIIRAIADADTFVVLLSRELTRNLAFELGVALAGGVRVIPVLLESVELPADIASLQYIDVRSERGLEQLIEAVK